MSTPPPPPFPGPEGQNPPAYNPPPTYSAPPGYQPYGAGVPPQPTNSGMAIAGMVLSLVGLIPCFWVFQIPAVLGTIFGFIGMKQTKGGARKGRGMAIAGVVVGIILIVVAVAFWVWVASHDNCEYIDNEWVCYNN